MVLGRQDFCVIYSDSSSSSSSSSSSHSDDLTPQSSSWSSSSMESDELVLHAIWRVKSYIVQFQKGHDDDDAQMDSIVIGAGDVV